MTSSYACAPANSASIPPFATMLRLLSIPFLACQGVGASAPTMRNAFRIPSFRASYPRDVVASGTMERHE